MFQNQTVSIIYSFLFGRIQVLPICRNSGRDTGEFRGPHALVESPETQGVLNPCSVFLHHTTHLVSSGKGPLTSSVFLPSSSDGEKGPHPMSQPQLVGRTGDISSDRPAPPAQPTPPGLGTSFLFSLRTCWAVLCETRQKQWSRGRGWTALFSHPPLDSTWNSQVRDRRALCASLESPITREEEHNPMQVWLVTVV